MKIDKANDRIPQIEWKLAKKLAARARKNAKFIALAPAVKRVAIAKDVLKWLDTGKLVAHSGHYLLAPVETEDTINGFTCDACALGSLFACAVEHGDAGGTVREEYRDRFIGGFTSFKTSHVADTFDGAKLYEKLKDIFATDQLVMIEAAFEGRYGLPATSFHRIGAKRDFALGGWKDVPQFVQRAFDWYDSKRHLSDEGRMRAIMHSIIDNNGEFVL